MGKTTEEDRWWSLEHWADGDYRLIEASGDSQEPVVQFTSLDQVEQLLSQCSKDLEKIQYKEGKTRRGGG